MQKNTDGFFPRVQDYLETSHKSRECIMIRNALFFSPQKFEDPRLLSVRFPRSHDAGSFLFLSNRVSTLYR